MNLDILIGSDNKCRLKVKDITPDTEYISDKWASYNRLNTKVIDILKYNKVGKDKYIVTISDNTTDTIYLNIPEDGYISLSHIVVPSKEYILENEDRFNKYSKAIYVYCADDTNIYRYFQGDFKEIDPEVILMHDNTYQTTMSRVDKDYVSICFLKKCYVNLCLQIFNGLCGLNPSKNKGCFSNNIDKDLQTRRDIVWMGINVIKYLVQIGQSEEAERIIELLEGCNGICSGESYTNNKSSGCGCSKT